MWGILVQAAIWLGRAGMAAFAVNEILKLSQGEKDTMAKGLEQAQASGMSIDEQKQIVAAITYEQAEKDGKNPDDFWDGLSAGEKEALQFSPESLRRSMDRTKFGGIGGALLFAGAAVAMGVASFRGIPILVKTLAKLADARNLGKTALELTTILEEGKIAGLAKVWVPGAVAGLLTAGGYYVSGLTNNMNDADLWGRIFLGQAADDFNKAAAKAGGGSGTGSSGLTGGSGPRTIIRMVEEKKPTQFLGTLFSAKLGKLEHFDRKLDDEITSMDDLETDVKLNVNHWLQTLPGRMGYSIIIRKDPVDENGVQQSGIWATATLHVLQLSGKILPIDTILLGPVTPAIRLELAKSTKTVETQIDGIVSAQEIREIDIPGGAVDIFSTTGERVFQSGNTKTETKEETKTQGPPAGYKTEGIQVPKGSKSAEGLAKQGYWLGPHPSSTSVMLAYEPLPKTAAPTPSAPSSSSSSTLKEGSSGAAVRELQLFLNTRGESLLVDGNFGAKTKAAVQRFQSANGLTSDGVVGPQTKAKMLSGGKDSLITINTTNVTIPDFLKPEVDSPFKFN